MGIDSISKLDTIIEKNKENYFEISYRNFIGFLRTVMLIHDADEYFNKAWRNDWTILDIKDYEYLKVYIDNIDELIHIYDIIIDP